MYLEPTTNHWACDIEGDGLRDTVSEVWCVCLENIVTGEKLAFTNPADFLLWLTESPNAILVGHNFIAYDAPVLNRIWGSRIGIGRIVDTMVLSMLYSPGLAGGHSLGAWGQRVKLPKGDFNDFSKLSDEMLKYCANDVALTALVYRRLTARMRQAGFSERGCELEHRAWHIIQNKQRIHGFPFDYKRAQELYVTLRARQEELRNEIHNLWPPRLECVGEYKQSRKKDGSPTADYLRHCGQYPRVDLEPSNAGYRVYDYVEFNLGSPQQRVAKLLEAGWTPTNFTPKTKNGGGGNPQVDEDSLLAWAELSGIKEGLALAKWLVCSSRANMVNTWLNAYNEKTGAIHGQLWIAGTLRYRHNNPNSANVPAVRLTKDDKIRYGEEGSWAYESRDLFTCGSRDGYSLVGIDGTGIQNRCLIHNLILTIGEDALRDFIDLSLEGDIHKRNIDILGVPNKAAAKKFYYTLMMGGGGARLAADQVQFGVHMTAKQAEAKKKALIDSMPGFGQLIKKLQRELDKTGRMKLCDDTPILVPSPHMVIPYLLQGDESRLMKQALIYTDEEVRRHKLDAVKVADIHDEWQWKVKDEHVEPFIRYSLSCFPRAGDSFGYRILISGAAKVGKTWAETH